MLDREDPHLRDRGYEAVERHVPGTAVGDYELADLPADPASDQGVVREQADGGADRFRCTRRSIGISIREELEGALEMSDRSRRIDYFRHSFGRVAFLPFASAAIQAWTSSAR